MLRTRELERDGGELLLFAFAEVALDKAALHKHQLPRCVRSGHPDAARNDGPVAPPPDELRSSPSSSTWHSCFACASDTVMITG